MIAPSDRVTFNKISQRIDGCNCERGTFDGTVGAPVLNTHSSWSLRDVLGVIVEEENGAR